MSEPGGSPKMGSISKMAAGTNGLDGIPPWYAQTEEMALATSEGDGTGA